MDQRVIQTSSPSCFARSSLIGNDANPRLDQYNNGMYPSLTPHPNPNHYLNSHTPNASPFTRASSPLSAQAFSSSLRSPGVYQPTAAAPLAMDANAVEQARSKHGPQCKSIPKLKLSQYPDPSTGKQSMWTWCPDCGSVERTQ